jgi:hypothetical protein
LGRTLYGKGLSVGKHFLQEGAIFLKAAPATALPVLERSVEYEKMMVARPGTAMVHKILCR